MKKYDYSKISTYFKLNKLSFILATITGVIYNVLMAFVPIVQGKLIDLYMEQGDAKYIIYFALSFLAFVVFIQVNRFLKRYYVRDFSNRMVLQMRRVSFSNLLYSNIEDFNNSTKGDIMNKNLSDIKDSCEGVRKVLTEVYDSIILMIGYFVSLMIMDYKISLIITLFIVVSMICANLLKKIIYKTTSDYKKYFSKSKDITLNSLKNEIYYRGFGVSNNYYNKYESVLNELEKKSIKSMIYKCSLEPIYQAIALVGLFFVMYLGGCYVIDGIWLIGTFSAYLTTYMLVAKKASKVGKVFNAATTLNVSWRRCLPFLVNKDNTKEIICDDKNNSLIVDDLTFGFDESFQVKNISFKLNGGEALGICGMIHSGKSTLGGALSGLYNYDGSIKLYGVELKNVRNARSDNFISYLPSNCEIFNDTLKYNISFTDSDVTRELYISCLNEDIDDLEDKENEILSHSCCNLSGGEQKRLQIARGVYGNPRLIIMDDPFNAIDINMSEEITDNIRGECSSSILVIINNQKEILKKMDFILFLKNDGYIYGKYDELLNDPDFSKLVGVKYECR